MGIIWFVHLGAADNQFSVSPVANEDRDQHHQTQGQQHGHDDDCGLTIGGGPWRPWVRPHVKLNIASEQFGKLRLHKLRLSLQLPNKAIKTVMLQVW